MSREAARLPQNLRWSSPQRALTFFTESPTPDSTGVLDTLRCFLKIC